ncbi:response regulator [Panacibacter ginsenosidivorans]|nr:response regulator [Panacibacter ginsenosidivorans]
MKILIIDDEEDYCMLIKDFYSSRNCETQMAHTLKDGLPLLEIFSPEILFLDNNLPDGSGWTFVDTILNKNPGLRIHLVSAYKPETKNISSLDKVKVWEKPISLKNLAEIIQV